MSKLKPMDERHKELIKQVNKARHFPVNTCPASRHVQIMGECILEHGGKALEERYAMLQEEPEHCAESMLSTVGALYEARTRIEELEKEYKRVIDLHKALMKEADRRCDDMERELNTVKRHTRSEQ